MEITTKSIDCAISKADEIMHKTFADYVTPIFDKIIITKANGYWASIKKLRIDNHYELRVSHNFNYYNTYDNALKALLLTIVHELVHTLKGCYNHGENFKRASKILYNKWGIVVKARTAPKDGFIKDLSAINREYKYTIMCTKCGLRINYNRKSKAVMFPERYICPKCKCDKLISFKI